MKRLLVAAALLSASLFVTAQEDESFIGFQKGDGFLSGTVSYSNSKTGDFKTSNLTLAPRAGFFVSDKVAIGGGIAIQSNKNVEPDFSFDRTVKVNTTAIDAFVRNYLMEGRFMPFGEFGVSYISSKTSFEDVDDSEFKQSGFGLGASAGLNYFVSDNFALEASWAALTYTSVKPEDRDGFEFDSTNTFSANFDLSAIRLGLLYRF